MVRFEPSSPHGSTSPRNTAQVPLGLDEESHALLACFARGGLHVADAPAPAPFRAPPAPQATTVPPPRRSTSAAISEANSSVCCFFSRRYTRLCAAFWSFREPPKEAFDGVGIVDVDASEVPVVLVRLARISTDELRRDLHVFAREANQRGRAAVDAPARLPRPCAYASGTAS